MENQIESESFARQSSESFTWFDDLAAPQLAHRRPGERQSSPWLDDLPPPPGETRQAPSQLARPIAASVFVQPRQQPEPRIRAWVLALAAIAGASVFVVVASLFSLL